MGKQIKNYQFDYYGTTQPMSAGSRADRRDIMSRVWRKVTSPPHRFGAQETVRSVCRFESCLCSEGLHPSMMVVAGDERKRVSPKYKGVQTTLSPLNFNWSVSSTAKRLASRVSFGRWRGSS